jgi:glycosyltransferase involved in cell wall biosynthesis
MATPAVSVIIPTHNRADLLRRSVCSVLGQTFRDFELIVVDDASKDHTQQVLAEFDDPRLHVIKKEKNARAAAARNDGLRLARAPLIAFQDDDDMWLPHKLERQVAAMRAQPEEVGVLVASYWRLMGKAMYYAGGDAFFANLDFRRGDPGGVDYALIATPNLLVRRSALDRAGNFDERLRSWDDWELGLRLWKVCRFAHLDDALSIQDFGLAGRMMSDDAARLSDLKIIRDKHADVWRDAPKVRAIHHFFIGRRECSRGNFMAGRAELRACLKANPLHLRAWGALIVSIFGNAGMRLATKLWHAVRY